MTAAEVIDDSLPLPHGTDVVTRVSRVVESEEVAPGTVGRVVGTHGDELVDRARIIAPSADAATHQAKAYLKQLYGSLFDQGLLATKSFEALAAYARGDPDPSELPRRLRPKNA